MRACASVGEIAQEHGVHPTSLYQWKALYRAGKINTPESSLSSATFLPVSVVSAVRSRQPAARHDSVTSSTILQLMLTSGATLRIETGHPDICSSDQSNFNLLATVLWISSRLASRHFLGRRPLSHCSQIRVRCAIFVLTAVALDLATDGGW
jgi:transposase-like protein